MQPITVVVYFFIYCIFVDTRIRWVSLIINFPTDKVTRLSNERSYGIRTDGQTICGSFSISFSRKGRPEADPCGQRERNAKRDFCPHFLDSFFQRNGTPCFVEGDTLNETEPPLK